MGERLLRLHRLEHQSAAALDALAAAEARVLRGALIADGEGHREVGADRLAEGHLPALRAEDHPVAVLLLDLELRAAEAACHEAGLVLELEDAHPHPPRIGLEGD